MGRCSLYDVFVLFCIILSVNTTCCSFHATRNRRVGCAMLSPLLFSPLLFPVRTSSPFVHHFALLHDHATHPALCLIVLPDRFLVSSPAPPRRVSFSSAQAHASNFFFGLFHDTHAMANPRQRRKARSSSHSGASARSKKAAQKRLHRTPDIKGPSAIREKWDPKLTVRQK